MDGTDGEKESESDSGENGWSAHNNTYGVDRVRHIRTSIFANISKFQYVHELSKNGNYWILYNFM